MRRTGSCLQAKTIMTDHTQILLFLFISLSLLTGAGLRHLLKNTRLPYTVVLLCLGILTGVVFDMQLLERSEHVTETLHYISNLNPHLILFLFLPLLVFESAYSLEVHLFRRALSQISLLAVIGLILAMLMTAWLVHVVFGWNWIESLLFGALISATDPVAVVALLKEMNARKRLQTILEGESLLNDGTAIVMFSLFFSLLASSSLPEHLAISTVLEFSRIVLLGLLTGLVLSVLTINWIKHVFNDALIEITLSIVIAYLSFYIAEELLHASGIVAVVTTALIYAGPGRSRISPEVSHFLQQFWEVMAYFANTMIFLLAGFLIAPAFAHAGVTEWLWLLIIFISLLIIRALTILILSPLLARLGLGMTRQKAIILIWGGLRGAVALAMAMAITRSELISQSVSQQILFYTGGIVFFSMIINATSMPAVMRRLKLDQLPPGKQLIIDRAKLELNTQTLERFDHIQEQQLLKHTNWQPIKKSISSEISRLESEVNNHDVSENDISLAFRRRMLEIERKTYWNTLEQGTIEPATAAILSEMVDTVLDHYPAIGPRQQLLDSLDAQTTLLGNVSLVQRLQQKYHQLTSDRDPTHIYQLARAFLNTQNILLDFVDILAPNERLFHEIRDEIQLNLDLVTPVVEDLEQQHAEALRESDTQIASDSILYIRREILYQMQEQGLLDDAEADSLIRQIEKQIIKQHKKPH